MSALVAQFEIEGEPVVKGRPRFTRNGRTYTPKTTVEAELRVAEAFKAAAGGFVPERSDVYALHVLFEMGTLRRKDIDNLLKLVMDALNGVAWVDDHQVVEVLARKVFVLKKAAAKTVVHVTRAEALAVGGKK